jgi:hypothetical protein
MRTKVRTSVLAPFDVDQSFLQTRASLLSFALLLRCDLTILSDIIEVRDRTPAVPGKSNEIEVNFSMNRQDCEKLIEEANGSMHKVQEVEGHILGGLRCSRDQRFSLRWRYHH